MCESWLICSVVDALYHSFSFPSCIYIPILFYLYLVFILSHSLESNPHLILQNTVFIPAVNIKPFPPVISRSIWASVIYATGSVMSFNKGYRLLYTLLLLMWSLQQEVQTVVTQTDWSSSITASFDLLSRTNFEILGLFASITRLLSD